jgi:type III restriction enzyme
MPRKASQPDPKQGSQFDVQEYLKTAPCVPLLRQRVAEWRAKNYPGATEITRQLLHWWFQTDHRLGDGRRFQYHASQRDAIETLIYVYEVEQVRTRRDLLQRYARQSGEIRIPQEDDFARYCTKMATGSGKTKVMSLAVVWHYWNAVAGGNDRDYARTFLIIAPNVIVLERLKSDFAGGHIFQVDPVMPPFLRALGWEMDYVMRGEGERATAQGLLLLTNIQQLYERADRKRDDELDALTDVLGPRPAANPAAPPDFASRIAARDGSLLVINDEAHHTHDEESEWNNIIHRLHDSRSIANQLDFSATPRVTKGTLFPWVISDYPMKQAIVDGVVKRPYSSHGVAAWCKIPDRFGFAIEYTDQSANLRYYYPDFVARAQDGTHWLIETKGAETTEVAHKDAAAKLWCENATALTGVPWRYLKIPQKAFRQMEPTEFSELELLGLE